MDPLKATEGVGNAEEDVHADNRKILGREDLGVCMR